MAASANSTPTPTPATNPIQRPPSLCMKPLPPSTATSPGAGSPPVSLTSKEWIVPPRPKPGRKPATDTPPTKRKAQNRAAQRAFRERRAARVGELEEQLKEIEDQHEQEQENLRANVADLEQSLEKCRADLAAWMSKCHRLEAELVQAHEILAKHRGHQDQNTASDPHAVGCGNCTLDSHCQCIDDVVKGLDEDCQPTAKSQSGQTDHGPVPKKIKLETSDTSTMEIDFTTAFSKAPTASQRATHTSAVVADPCGFCQDGTPCICAEMAAEQDRHTATRPDSPVQQPHPVQRQMAQFTPPPSEGDVSNSSIPLGGCASNPGTCAQCLADPKSTLFCKALAASRDASGQPSGCCGGRGADGGCCQSSVPLPPRNTRSRTATNSNMRLPAPTNTRNPVTLSCADAYTALSRHAGYEQASGDMASWMPKLHANTSGIEGRPAMEIDAANVMAVLKDFDRRFGSNK